YCELILKDFPNHLPTLMRRGTIFFFWKQYDQALNDLSKIIELTQSGKNQIDKDNCPLKYYKTLEFQAFALIWRAIIYLKLQKFDLAQRDITQLKRSGINEQVEGLFTIQKHLIDNDYVSANNFIESYARKYGESQSCKNAAKIVRRKAEQFKS